MSLEQAMIKWTKVLCQNAKYNLPFGNLSKTCWNFSCKVPLKHVLIGHDAKTTLNERRYWKEKKRIIYTLNVI